MEVFSGLRQGAIYGAGYRFPHVIQGQLFSSLGLSFPLCNMSVWTSWYLDSF